MGDSSKIINKILEHLSQLNIKQLNNINIILDSHINNVPNFYQLPKFEWRKKHRESTNCQIDNSTLIYLRDILKKINKPIVLTSEELGAVINTGDPTTYGILSDDFINMKYWQKVDFLLNLDKKHIKNDLNIKNWHRQQWPHNSIQFANENNYHLIHIQSDFTYCLYPSIFAMAMYGTLFEKINIIVGGFHLSGPNIDLFCVGELKNGQMLIQNIKNYSRKLYNHTTIRGYDVQWYNMSSSFRNSFLSENHQEYHWLRYPWEIISNTQTHYKKVDIMLESFDILAVNNITVRVKRLSDIIKKLKKLLIANTDNFIAIIIIDNKRYKIDIHWPLALQLISTKKINLRYNLSVNPGVTAFTNYYHYGGTFNKPVITLENGKVLTTMLIKNVINSGK